MSSLKINGGICVGYAGERRVVSPTARYNPPMHALGLIAGAGRFPFMVAEGARSHGLRVAAVGLRGFADESLAQAVDEFHWAGLAKPGRWIRLLRRAGAERVILAGSVQKDRMYGRWRMLRLWPDLTALKIWFLRIPDKRNDTVLRAVADELARHGLIMDECVKYTPEHMAPEGVLTRRGPSAAQERDIEFGWPIAREMGRLDIGQSIAVKETEVIAVEAIEGTDRMIERAGQLCPRGGWTLIKVAKPNQDMRFDVPTVGAETIEKLGRAGGTVLVVEAGMTVIVDREAMVAAAERVGIIVVARRG